MSPPYSVVSAPYEHSSLRVFQNKIYRAFVLAAEWRDLWDVREYIRATRLVAVYVLVGASGGTIYCRIGEGAKLYDRLIKHQFDPKLLFVQNIFVLSSDAFDKANVIYLQERITQIAQEAGRSEVMMGVSPISGFPQLRGDREALDHILAAALGTLADAGCHVLRPRASDRCSASRAPRICL